jgi:hypothetical protein
MKASERPCDLCALPVGVKPFCLAAPGKTLAFCCEGCLGIYQMLHQINEQPPAPAQNGALKS